MRLQADMLVRRDEFQVRCQAEFGRGLHLVSGPVGSGKSSLALAMAGLLAHEGELLTEGINETLISFQFPEHQVTASRLDDELRSWSLEADELLSSLGLLERRGDDPLRLSRGTLKALNLACVIERNPDLLILDEPFSSLDCVAKESLCRKLETRRGITIIFSHERGILPKVDSLSQMRGGELESLGSPQDAIPRWEGAPPYLREALRQGAEPENVRLEDAMEALCRMRG